MDKSIQRGRWETSMAIFHNDPVGTYERAIGRHQRAIWRLKDLIKKLKKKKR